MKTTGICRILVAIGIISLVANVAPSAADGKKLAKDLAGDLGISEDQAIGGTQALLDVAKGNLGDEEFSKLLSGDADLGDLMDGDRGSAKANGTGCQRCTSPRQ